ncbi:cytochrome P450 [Mycobacteroides abscessus]|uniref:cytochrome P450 n=1 Tax=Mycobacteroides abscessus TaxID=36809 RepID=UPI0009A591D9|nr:cytochrome P450 [Mycobacteroides abscessus]
MTSPHPPVSDIDIYSDEVLDDPYEAYRALRNLGPVVQLTSQPVWAITRYADVRSALANAEVFSSAAGVGISDEMNALQAGSVLASDDPQHAVLRSVLSEKVSPRALAKLKSHINQEADALVAQVVAAGSFDAVSDLSARLPVSVVADLIGLPIAGREVLLTGADAMFASFGPMNQRLVDRMPEVMSYMQYMTEMATRESLAPGSWGAAILDAVDDGRLGPESAMPLMGAYLIASMDTTVHALSSYIRFLAEDPSLWSRMKADPSLIGKGLEENLRLESPAQSFTRRTTRAIDVDGTVIPEGTRVAVCIASANRDERKYQDPDRFDLDRDAFDHLAFGYATHGCAGQGLARMETQALISALLRRVERIEIVEEPVRHQHPIIRGLERLQVAVVPSQGAE